MFGFHISIKFLTTLAMYISKLRKDLHKSQELICFPLRGKSTIPRQEPSTFFGLSRTHLQYLLDFIGSLSVTLVVELTMERANFSLEVAFIRSRTGTSSRITHCTFKWYLGGAWPWPCSRSGLGARRVTRGWWGLGCGFSCLRNFCWDMADNTLLHNAG